MIRPDIDGRLALRVREIADLEVDTITEVGGQTVTLSAHEKACILNAAADVLEEYILAARSVISTPKGPAQ